MTTPPAPTVPMRTPDLALARVHLRLGALALARAELETLAGRDALDADGLLDLVEARWRTGDLTGAGEAAALVLGDESDGPLIALVVSAEAALHRGRPTEARRYADLAVAAAGASIDAVFAGMPRGPIWPPDATELPAPAPTLFETPIAGSALAGGPATGPVPGSAGSHPAPVARPGAAPAPDPGGPDVVVQPGSIGLWESVDGVPAPTAGAGAPDRAGAGPIRHRADVAAPDGATLLDLGRAALDSGDPAEAAVRFALALRLEPTLAATVLAAIADDERQDLTLVRGDAFRLLGREPEARAAYAEAARATAPSARPAHPPDPPTPEGDPA